MNLLDPWRWRTACRTQPGAESVRTLVIRVDVEVVKGGRETLRPTLLETPMTLHERPET